MDVSSCLTQEPRGVEALGWVAGDVMVEVLCRKSLVQICVSILGKVARRLLQGMLCKSSTLSSFH